jgi:hypothetical protein
MPQISSSLLLRSLCTRTLNSRNGAGFPREWDGILQITFAPDGRCREHREWFSVRDLQD